MGHGMVGCHFAAVLIVHLKCVIRKIQVFGKAYLAAILGKPSNILLDVSLKFVKSTQLCLCSKPGSLAKELLTYLQGDRHRPHMQDISRKDLAVSSNRAIPELHGSSLRAMQICKSA